MLSVWFASHFVCFVIFGLSMHLGHFQELTKHLTGRLSKKVACRWSIIDRNSLETRCFDMRNIPLPVKLAVANSQQPTVH